MNEQLTKTAAPITTSLLDASEFAKLSRGDHAPHFRARSDSSPRLIFDSMAGRYLVLCFYATAGDAEGRSAIDAMLRCRDRFDGHRASSFGVSLDPSDESNARVSGSAPGVHFIWDFDGAVSKAYGAIAKHSNLKQRTIVRRFWMVVDPTLHVLAIFPFITADDQHRKVMAFLDDLPDPSRFAGFEIPAPILVLPHVLEPELCDRLIALYDQDGGSESGVMRTIDGIAKGVLESDFKRRKDFTITDDELIRLLQVKIRDRVAPEIEKLFFMKITRMERYIVGCYSAEDGGHFAPHRDNGMPITAHRRFAVSINLNGDFEGGEVSFPEYNLRGHKGPPGWAVIFPCAILHAVSKVTKGRRYAFLPFVYDEAGRKLRDDFVATQEPTQI
jgi:peroxiredoxin/predicted 2-oxoglutarate/Fe(II)-dependent dioxygenase YbiX